MKFSLITVAMALASASAQTAVSDNTVAEQELNQMIEDEQGLLQQEIELLTSLTAEEVPLEGMTATHGDISIDDNDNNEDMAINTTADEPEHTSEAEEMEHKSAPAAEEVHHESNHQHKKSEKERAKAAKAAGHDHPVPTSKSSKKHHAALLSMMTEEGEEGHHSKAHHTKQTKSSKTHHMSTMMAEEEHSMVYKAKSAKSMDAHSMRPDHVVYKAKSAKSKSAKAKSSKAHMSMPHASVEHSMPMAKSAKAHAELSKAAKANPPLVSKAHKAEKSGKKMHHHRGDDGSLSMTMEEEDTMMENHGGVTNGDNGDNGDSGGGTTTSETAASTTTDTPTTGAGDLGNLISSMMTPAVVEAKDVILNGDNTNPVVRTPDVSPHGTDTSKLKSEQFTQKVKEVLLHGEKAIGGHNKKQNVDVLDMGDGSDGAESSLLASTSNVISSATVRGVMVGGFCLLATSVYAMFA